MAMQNPNDDTLIFLTPKEDLKPKFHYMRKIIKASQWINMWPSNKKRNFLLYHIVFWIVVTNCVSLVLSFIIQVRNEFKNMDSITELIDFVTVFISGTFRYLYIYFRGEKYLDLVSSIHDNFIHYSLIQTEHKACIEKYYKQANRLIMVYGTFTCFWILQICLVPIISYVWANLNLEVDFNSTEIEPIPYPVAMKIYAPFDYYKQPANALFYIYQFIGFMIFGFIYILVDSFWYMVILLSIGQFALLIDSVNNISKILKKNETKEVELLNERHLKQVEEALKRCIEHHQFTRKFVHQLDDISNPNILVDSLHAVISIGFILLDVTININTGDWNKVLYSLEYFITSIVHMFCFDWLGNELAIKEEELAEAVYNIPWYKMPSQKPILLLMTIQSRRPYRLTGGKMYKLSLEFFTSTIKAVFSYFTFLLQMRNGKLGTKK